jgi:hypothetical protein
MKASTRKFGQNALHKVNRVHTIYNENLKFFKIFEVYDFLLAMYDLLLLNRCRSGCKILCSKAATGSVAAAAAGPAADVIRPAAVVIPAAAAAGLAADVFVRLLLIFRLV